jgi:hypothetical protein
VEATTRFCSSQRRVVKGRVKSRWSIPPTAYSVALDAIVWLRRS